MMLSVRVAARQQQALDICSYDLVAADPAAPLPSFEAGAHIDVHVPGGQVRQYSLWNDPRERGIYRIGVLRDTAGRGGSQAMHAGVHAGTQLTISAPRNQFPLAQTRAHSLLLAGGIGITPLLCMAQVLAARQAPFALHYCSRSRERAAFLDRLQAPDLADHVHLHLDDGPPEQRLPIDAVLAAAQPGTHLYVCGPKGFLDAVLGQAQALAWPLEQLHHESFQGATQVKKGDRPFTLELARSGRRVSVAVGQTATQALLAAGVDVPVSCEQGICGTCVTTVLDGIPEHRDSYLLPEERASNTCFTPCCSRARTSVLVLDL